MAKVRVDNLITGNVVMHSHGVDDLLPDVDSRYVNVTGDTMSGALSINLDSDDSVSTITSLGNNLNWNGNATLNMAVGQDLVVDNYGSGTITNAIGIRYQVRNRDTLGTGTITNGYGLSVLTPTVGAGNIVNEYGLYIDDQNTADTLNYAIYTNAGAVRFGDEVVIASPTAPALTIGAGTAGVTYNITFDGEDNDGVIQWKHSLDTFESLDAWKINAGASTNIALIVEGAESQTEDLQRWTDSNGVVLSVVDNEGKVGIGEANPSASLNLYTDSKTLMFLAQNDGQSGQFRFDVHSGVSTISTIAPVMTMVKTQGTLASQEAVENGDRLGTISWLAHDGGDTNTTSAIIQTTVSGSVTTNSIPSRIVIESIANAGDTSRTEYLRLSGSGVVVNEGSKDLDFRVESNNDAFLFFADGDNDRITIGTGTSGGKVRINDADHSTTTNGYASVFTDSSFENTGDNNNNDVYGFLSNTAVSSTSTANIGSVTGGYFVSSHASTSGLSDIVGIEAVAQHTVAADSTMIVAGLFKADAGAGTVAALKGIYIDELDTTSGTTTEVYGIDIDSPTIGAGTLTNAYGINISDIDAAGTINYAIKTGAGYLATGGGRIVNTTTVHAATYDLTVDDQIIHVTYASVGTVTSLTLPSAQVVDGRVITIKDAAGNASTYNITIDTEGAETIDGSATYVISSDYGSVNLYSDGSNWFIY